ncbi:L-cysteine desulfhydrase [Morus notabilis]|uniref:L-cysteine desulfhydrase n=1 Tax=Morus notabilis TaxID=981085 RepID=UPI000CED4D71|nr:L-cysteine desulfhydrase [Morus notabilis]
MEMDEERTRSPTNTNNKNRIISWPEIQQEFSHHQPSIARLNNGSFGCCPSSVLAAHHSFQLRFLRHPDAFHLHVLPSALLRSRTILARLINADHVDQISLIDNATTAAALVLQHISRLPRNDAASASFVVVVLDCAFQAVKKSLHAYVARAGGSVVEIHLPFPVRSHRQIIAEFRKGLERAKSLNGGKIRLAIIDHITSMPSVLIPVRELVEICREEGVEQVFVDAAHALGTVPIDVKEIGADFYVSNLHKWFFCPPSVAVLYCRESNNNVPMPIESSLFLWTGTSRDYSAQLVVPAVMEFVNRFEGGIEGIMKRNHDNVVEMGKMLANSWGTILGSPPHMCASMIMVGLPSRLCITTDDHASRLRTHLRECFGVEVPIYYDPATARDDDGESRAARDEDGGVITAYARISHQIYNTVDDYHKFRDAINQLVKDGKFCKMLSTEGAKV